MADIRALRNAKARAWRIGIRQARTTSHRWQGADQYQCNQAYDFRLFLEDSNCLIEKSTFILGILFELRIIPYRGRVTASSRMQACTRRAHIPAVEAGFIEVLRRYAGRKRET
ncbi:hypothetical protein KCU57_04810 [Xanthomonas translucens]|uniref:hypothetical protein n=1 Tax=Xanthomonas campestris pv. translucens TaxID=343 RepID=UPI001F25CBD2|nr:hypothetical protein [Xanthomonas translucens]UKE52853.1 hypothetical protein KCU57_04810 [Xanthomonas translucens]